MVARIASSNIYKIKKADSVKLIAEIANSKRPQCLNREFCKYYYGYISLSTTDLKKDLYNWQVW